MEIENPFSFFTETEKTHLKISIPSFPAKHWTIRWDKSLLHDSKAITAPERAKVVRYYQEHGFLNGYNEKTINDMRIGNRGWIIAHPWNMPTDNPSYVRIFERNAYWNLAERLWRPMFYTLTDNMDLYDYTEYTVPVFPKIVTMDFVNQWYQANQANASFFQRVKKKSEQTIISEQQDEEKIILKIKNHPFVNQPVQRVLLYPTVPKVFPRHLSQEEQEFLHLKLLRRDAYRLKGLTDGQRSHLSHMQPNGLESEYRVHWCQWLCFGGEMTLQNALLVSRDTEIKYHTFVQKPFEEFWEKNWNSLSQTHQPVYVDIPVPMTGYRPTPIRPVKTKRQDRRQLNHLTQQAVFDYQYGD